MSDHVAFTKPNPKFRYTICRDRRIDVGSKPLVMGILNVTPDSFSDGGRYETLDKALRRAEEMVQEGADLIDVGGESTRPGAVPVEEQEELERVIPVIEKLADHVDVPISVDTYKAEVARQAIEAGAHIVNDIWGLKHDAAMADVVAASGAGVILMHNRTNIDYVDLAKDVVEDLRESLSIAARAGIADDRIWLDPGIGFAKDVNQNLQMMARLSDIVELGYPVLLGTSRKSMIWRTLGTTPDDCMSGTAATIALGVAQGCRIIRVHDVAEMRQAALITDSIITADEHKD